MLVSIYNAWGFLKMIRLFKDTALFKVISEGDQNLLLEFSPFRSRETTFTARQALLKRGVMYKERICFPWEQILSLKSRSLFKSRQNNLVELSLKMYQYLLMSRFIHLKYLILRTK